MFIKTLVHDNGIICLVFRANNIDWPLLKATIIHGYIEYYMQEHLEGK